MFIDCTKYNVNNLYNKQAKYCYYRHNNILAPELHIHTQITLCGMIFSSLKFKSLISVLVHMKVDVIQCY